MTTTVPINLEVQRNQIVRAFDQLNKQLDAIESNAKVATNGMNKIASTEQVARVNQYNSALKSTDQTLEQLSAETAKYGKESTKNSDKLSLAFLGIVAAETAIVYRTQLLETGFSALATAFSGISKEATLGANAFSILNNTFGMVKGSILQIVESFKNFPSLLLKARSAFPSFTSEILNFNKELLNTTLVQTKNISTLVSGAFELKNAFASLGQRVFGTAAGLAALGSGLILLGHIFTKTDNTIIKYAGSILELIGLALAPLSITMQILLTRVGSYVEAFGTKLVRANISAMESFQRVSDSVTFYNRSLESLAKTYPGTFEGAKEFEKIIDDTNYQLGISKEVLRSSALNIATLGTGMGLTGDQMQTVLKRAIDLSVAFGRDLTDTSSDVLMALQGNSRAMIQYGVRLDDAKLKTVLLARGIASNVSKLTAAQETQLKYNIILDETARIQDSAGKAVGTYTTTQRKLQDRLGDVVAAFGRGTLAVESFTIGQQILTSVIDSINPLVFSFAGFISSIGARIVQLTGFTMKYIVAVVLLTGAYTNLNIALAKNVVQEAAQANLFFGWSIYQALSALAGAPVQIKSVMDIFKTFATIFVFQIKRMTALMLGMEVATFSFGAAFVKVIGAASKAMLAFSVAVFTNPWVWFIVLIVASLYSLYKVFSVIEEKTAALSDLFNIFAGILNDVFGSLLKWESVFKRISSFITEQFGKAIGLAIANLVVLLMIITKLLEAMPRSIISEQRGKEIAAVNSKLKVFMAQLAAAEGNIFKVADANRKLASSNKSVLDSIADEEKGLKGLETALNKIRETIGQFAGRGVEFVQAQEKRDIETINRAIKTGLASRVEGEQLIREIRLKAEEDIEKARDAAFAKQKERFAKKLELDFQKLLPQIFIAPLKIKLEEMLGAITKGAEGGRAFIVEGVSKVLDAIEPGLGTLLKPFVDLFTKGAAETRKTVGEFLNSIPVTIKNIFEGLYAFIATVFKMIPQTIRDSFQLIPDILKSMIMGIDEIFGSILDSVAELPFILIESLPDIIDQTVSLLNDKLPETVDVFIAKLSEKAPDIVSALVNAMIIQSVPMSIKIITSFVGLMPFVATRLAIALVTQAPFIAASVVTELIRNIPLFVSEAGKQIGDSIRDAINRVTGGASGAVERVGGALGKIGEFASGLWARTGGKLLAQGGLVPEGFPQDRFPAWLSSGELVVDRGTTQKLDSYLDKSEGGENFEMLALLGSINSKLGQQKIVIQIGSKEIISVIRDAIESGRVFA